MHHISKIHQAGGETPHRYQSHSRGFRRSTYVDKSVGSVHMGVGVCSLDAGGAIDLHIHSFEESFFVLEGSLIVQIGDEAVSLGPGHFGLISTGSKHAFRNAGNTSARWLEMQAPQPRPLDYGNDTFFVGGEAPAQAAPPSSESKLIGHFDENQLPKPGAASQMEGFNPITGVAIKMFV